ncbi:MAG: oxygen-independent coproporphyrinogen III oxidase, partial [Zetaproteobacteria bacterium]
MAWTVDDLFDWELIRKYDRPGPRYTSYPTAPMFHAGIGPSEYDAALRRAAKLDAPLSLYVHIPFCDTVCYYCGCNKIATKQREKALPYLDALHREIAMVAERIGGGRKVVQLHFGGGTPTFLSAPQLKAIFEDLRAHFPFADDAEGEYGIEVDPRECDREMVFALREMGFNRISIGVQDFDPEVQRAVNRIQPPEITEEALAAAREAGFVSVNFDLMYGLPKQSVASFRRTIERTIALGPDRIALFNYAHLPQMFPPQRRINESDLPSPAEKLAILHMSIDLLTRAGYIYIGMDHFAKPTDELARAQKEGKLYRNFQGYSTHADCDLIGLGLTSIGFVDGAFFQNHKLMEDYLRAIAEGKLATMRGYKLSREDHLRRFVIMRIMCD